ncbi:hypothetical protein EVAR_39863_1 [Eumeta japonica]|uniref:RNase H type-1 domain-containing protein n=1 Tax=Eumeta variegata TaxID=151549 RepID=A0A4C1WU43_EUMVA|nr:hypothetical protein EVAR_39863_1 [Eumeta japonica]
MNRKRLDTLQRGIAQKICKSYSTKKLLERLPPAEMRAQKEGDLTGATSSFHIAKSELPASEERSSGNYPKDCWPTHSHTRKIQGKEIRAHGPEVQLFWLKAHIGRAENEKADELPKTVALRSDTPPDCDKILLSYVKKRIRDEPVLKWQDRYQSTSTGEVIKSFLQNMEEAFRAVRNSRLTPTQVQILTGYGGIASYLHRFCFKENPDCEYDAEVEETVWNILLECPRFLAASLQLEHKIKQDLTQEAVPHIMANPIQRLLFLEYAEVIFPTATKRNSGPQTRILTHIDSQLNTQNWKSGVKNAEQLEQKKRSCYSRRRKKHSSLRNARGCHLWRTRVTTSRIISVDTISVFIDIGELVDRLGCIKVSEVHEVMVYEDRGSERLQQRITEDKKAELEDSKQRAHKENSESYGRAFLGALGRAAKNLVGDKIPAESKYMSSKEEGTNKFIALASATLKVHIAPFKGILTLRQDKSVARLATALEKTEAAVCNNDSQTILRGKINIIIHMAAYNATNGLVALDKKQTDRTESLPYYVYDFVCLCNFRAKSGKRSSRGGLVPAGTLRYPGPRDKVTSPRPRLCKVQNERRRSCFVSFIPSTPLEIRKRVVLSAAAAPNPRRRWTAVVTDVRITCVVGSLMCSPRHSRAVNNGSDRTVVTVTVTPVSRKVMNPNSRTMGHNRFPPVRGGAVHCRAQVAGRSGARELGGDGARMRHYNYHIIVHN